jgi:hypothetical protein
MESAGFKKLKDAIKKLKKNESIYFESKNGSNENICTFIIYFIGDVMWYRMNCKEVITELEIDGDFLNESIDDLFIIILINTEKKSNVIYESTIAKERWNKIQTLINNNLLDFIYNSLNLDNVKVEDQIVDLKKIKKLSYNGHYIELIENLINILINIPYKDNEFYYTIYNEIKNYFLKSVKNDNNLIKNHFFTYKIIQFFEKNKKEGSCFINNNITIKNYLSKDPLVIMDLNLLKKGVNKCENKSDNIIIPIILENVLTNYYHSNLLIISPEIGGKRKVWRIDPNFSIIKFEESFIIKILHDRFKTGEIEINKITIKDSINESLYKFFKGNSDFNFEGYFPEYNESCPYHGGLCQILDILIFFLGDITNHDKIKYYLEKYFKYEYTQISNKPFIEKQFTIINIFYHICWVKSYFTNITKITIIVFDDTDQSFKWTMVLDIKLFENDNPKLFLELFENKKLNSDDILKLKIIITDNGKNIVVFDSNVNTESKKYLSNLFRKSARRVIKGEGKVSFGNNILKEIKYLKSL